MLRRSTLQLLRFHFSFFLMPVYWFGISQVGEIDIWSSIIVFFILHLLVYPASNGYNSYMDRDETSIGGLMKPSKPTKQLFFVTEIMDVLAICLSFFVSLYFVIGIFSYIVSSRLYSYRGIRLKKYPIYGYLTVVFFQGAVIFFLVYHGCSVNKTLQVPALCLLASLLLIGGFYPLTQIYQHKEDLKDKVKTLSYLLGYRGTFVFCGLMYCAAFVVLAVYFINKTMVLDFYILATLMLPVILYFFYWAAKVWKEETQANFSNTMRMNIIASVFTNISFIVILFR